MKKILFVMVILVMVIFFKDSILIWLMSVTDFVGNLFNLNVVNVIDFLNNLYYL